MIIKAIALRFGYVESNSLPWLVFGISDPVKVAHSSKEALHSLVEYLFQKFNPPHNKSHKKCCQKCQEVYPDSLYCSKCGTNLKKHFTLQEWCNYLQDLQMSDINDFHYSDGVDNPYGWDPSAFAFGIPDHHMLIIHEHAAEILTVALMEIHPELEKIVSEPDDLPNDYIVEDYQKLLDDTAGLVPKRLVKETIITEYPTGASEVIVDGIIDRITYNTGDTVWFDHQDGEYKVRAIISHDGIKWGNVEGETKR